MKDIKITDKELQQIGLRLVEAVPAATFLELTVVNKSVYLRARYTDDTSRTRDVPLLKEVEE